MCVSTFRVSTFPVPAAAHAVAPDARFDRRPPCDGCGGTREPGLRYCPRCVAAKLAEMELAGYLQPLADPSEDGDDPDP